MNMALTACGVHISRRGLDMAAHPGPITCFSHPDLPKKYGWRPSFDAREYNYEMALAAARVGRMIEVNTAGLRNDAREMYPAFEMLRSFYDAGVECTIGSDAHAPQDVAANLDRCRCAHEQGGVWVRDRSDARWRQTACGD